MADVAAAGKRATAAPARRTLTHVRKALAFAGRYVRGWFEPGRFIPHEPPKLSIETTNICNANCVFCANRVMTRRKQPLDLDDFRKAVDEFAAMGGVDLDFNATIGDPLLDPKLLERARYVRRYPQFATLGFVTTLQWLHRFDLDEFFAAGFTWLSVSTTLSGREMYKAFFQVDKYDQMLANLVALLEENNRRGRPLNIEIAVKPTDEPLERVLAHPDFQRVNALTPQDLEETVRRQGFYVDDWLGAVTLPPYLKKRPLYPRAFRPCQLLYAGLMVYSNGKVGACSCRDFEASSDLILGHVGEQSLATLWTGERLAALREDWRRRNHVPDICRSCRHYLY
ncbi:MAG: radical SAM protein [Acidobacteriota bacterium]|nr:radical SAM protein [Acidobacteriota bacterium]